MGFHFVKVKPSVLPMFAPKLTTDTSPELPFRLEGRLSAPDSVKSSVFDTSASNNVKKRITVMLLYSVSLVHVDR